ncbi:NAD(P)-dependent oxidoreductase [Pseudoramibacter faecis]|uniref:NAD(P)-dependent oxidoreductase n=1 Tax=Pseudoramibacter faecis TaxID=3108534 RepID=UPI002E77E633|nr:NAD(P)-dependent oxidoreductase [Pseudoramibacter sp. HA2172]
MATKNKEVKQMKIAFIGTGVMGGAMAGRLMAAGHDLTVYNRTKAKAEALIQKGARWAKTAEEAAADAEVVITMVGFPKDVESVYFGEEAHSGIIEAAPAGALLIDMTTTSPSLSQRIARDAALAGLLALDAPVSGGDVGARAGTLSIMVGGDPAAFEKARPLLKIMGSQVVYEGGPGSGQHTKMANQIAIAGTVAGVCEAVKYGQMMGLDIDKMLGSIGAGAAGSWQMANLAPKMAAGDYDPGFYVKHMIKDLTIAGNESDAKDTHLLVLETVRAMYKALRRRGMGECGTQAIAAYYDQAEADAADDLDEA